MRAATTSDSASRFGGVWRLGVRHLLLPKQGAGAGECEDAIGIDAERGRFSVADGATEAFDARGWAEHLAAGWIGAETLPTDAREFISWVERSGAEWEAAWRGRALPWYAEEKRRAGSFAAFIGLELREAADGDLGWRAAALGDACLVRVRDGRLLGALPIDDHRSFTATPRLAPSLAASQRIDAGEVCIESGTIESGDEVWLLSDAAAAWLLRELAEGSARRRELDDLLAAGEPDALRRFVAGEQSAGRMRDDDVAIVRIEVERA